MKLAPLVSLLAVLVMAGCASAGPQEVSPGGSTSAPEESTSSEATTATTVEQACRRDYKPRALPSWATAGFSPPTLPMPYVVGDRGDIVAILWSDHDPLVVPPAEDRNNKILWVARVSSGGPLEIRAQLSGSGESATRTVEGGPGPSIIDLPAPGCWSFDLTWGEQHDHLELEYAPR